MNNLPYRKKAVFTSAFLLLLSCSAVMWYGYYGRRMKIVSYDLSLLARQQNLVPLLIAGSGPAGLSAALYGARAGFKTVVLAGPVPGGQLMGTSDVENWPGTQRALGADLIAGLRNQAESFGATVVYESVESLSCDEWPFKVTLSNGKIIRALSLVIASGATPKKLNVPGEKEYWGKGVTTCATCDAPFYKNRDVIVVGGGDSAIEEAIQLAAFVKSVTIFVRKKSMRASRIMQERLAQYPQIAVKYEKEIYEIRGNGKRVTTVLVHDILHNKTAEQSIDGVFLAIGHTPNTEPFKQSVACDSDGYILLQDSPSQHTSVPGIFAAGDVSDKVYKQAGVAAGDGIKAALDAESFLREKVGWNTVLSTSLEHTFFEAFSFDPLPEIKSEKELNELLASSSVPVIIMFSGKACPSCVKLTPLVEKAAQKIGKKNLVFVKVDTGVLGSFAERSSIDRIPVLMLMRKGKEEARIEGEVDYRELMEFLKKRE